MTRIENTDGVVFWNKENRSSGTIEEALAVIQRCWPDDEFVMILEQDDCNDSEQKLTQLRAAVDRWWNGRITEQELKAVADDIT